MKIIGKSAGPNSNKDGVTVAKEIELKTGRKIWKWYKISLNDLAGDGTTTATVLAQSYYKKD
jgi:chaperonin GroEL